MDFKKFFSQNKHFYELFKVSITLGICYLCSATEQATQNFMAQSKIHSSNSLFFMLVMQAGLTGLLHMLVVSCRSDMQPCCSWPDSLISLGLLSRLGTGRHSVSSSRWPAICSQGERRVPQGSKWKCAKLLVAWAYNLARCHFCCVSQVSASWKVHISVEDTTKSHVESVGTGGIKTSGHFAIYHTW